MIKFINLFTIISMSFLFIGCIEKENNREIQVGKYRLVGDINKDSILNGIISYS